MSVVVHSPSGVTALPPSQAAVQAAAESAAPASSATIDVMPMSAPAPPRQAANQGPKPGSRFAALKAAESDKPQQQRRGKGVPKGVKFVDSASSKEDEAAV